MLALRPYQEECLRTIQESYHQGVSRQLISLPTGAGKTVVFSHLIKQLGFKTLVIAHTLELLEQAREKIRMISPQLDVGLVNATSKEFDSPVVVSTIQSAGVEANLEQLRAQNFHLLIYDEAHRASGARSREVLESLGFGKKSEKLLTGFTATAFRNDHRGLAEDFDKVVYQKKLREMILEGYLVKPIGMRIQTDIDLSQIEIGDGDFKPESLAQIMDTPELRKVIVDAYIQQAKGRRTICFAVNVQHAQNLSKAFKMHGIKSEFIHGGTPNDERKAILDQYRAGKIEVLCNCQILTEGFDCPQTDCVLIARPTQSRGLYQQMAGRGLRLWPNKKDCLILDVGSKSHSLCSTAQLLEDVEPDQNHHEKSASQKNPLLDKLPINLNQKLKAALLSFDPLSDSFSWGQHEGTFYLNAGSKIRLEVRPSGNELFEVALTGDKAQILAKGLNFEYAFASAEDFARANKNTFKVVDRSAAWRDAPASSKQIELIKSKTRCKVGLDKLTRGQASDLIGMLIAQN